MIRGEDDWYCSYLSEEPIPHASDAQLSEWVMRIRSNERGPEIDRISRMIIQDLYLRNFLSIEQNRVVMNWLTDALADILDHKDPLHTLGLLPRKNNRPSDSNKGTDIAMWVACAERLGFSRPDAKRKAAEIFHMDESNVNKLIRKSGSVEGMNPDMEVFIEYFKTRGKPLPTPSGNK